MLNEKGFTIVEGLISLVVLLLVFMGLMQGALVAIDANIKNTFRNEAQKIGIATLNEAKSIPFANLQTITDDPDIVRSFNDIQISYDADLTVRNIGDVVGGTRNRSVTVNVTWQWRGIDYNYTTSTIVSRT